MSRLDGATPGARLVTPARDRRPFHATAGPAALLSLLSVLPVIGPAAHADEPTPLVASRSISSKPSTARPEPRVPAHSRSPVADTTLADPIQAARQAIGLCQARYSQVDDYTCTFHKRERHDGKLTDAHVMSMKARSHPNSVYFRFVTPNKGREAIYVSGRHNDRVLAHDVGLFKVIAGTMMLDPRGETAMEGCRHPITEAGIGTLIETISREWERELTPGESRVRIDPGMTIGPRRCTLIESVHPERRPDYMFYMVRLYIDHELGLPVRFEAFDWPARAGAAPLLLEEYTYSELKLNVGLTDHDFDPRNRGYSFGRF